MRTLYYAGSFNPIHHGHLICARAVAETAGYDRVVIMPSAQNPFKSVVEADGADRLAMCKLAVENEPLFEISDLELNRSGPSYTIDTVRELRTGTETHIHWLIGADQILGLPKWRSADELKRLVHFVVMARPGVGSPPDLRLPEGFTGQIVPAPLLQISATEIRTRVKSGHPITWLTPVEVVQYINARGLYTPK